MICPKCGFEQPDSVDCMRCGIVISRYKGPVLAAAAQPAPPPPPPLPLASAAEPPVRPAFEAAATAWGGPEPQMATAGGTVYSGPLPAAAGGGTMFTGALQGGPVGTTRSRVPGTFELGKILGEAFSIYFSNFLPFVLLTALALSPMLAAFAMMSSSIAGEDAGLMVASLLLLVISFLICPQLATASITYGVFQQMRGRDATIADCLGKGMSSLLSVLGLAILQGLGILLGLILFIIPGIILALRWAVSVPVAVEERPGAVGALRRSRFLTDGYKGTIFGVLFVLNFISRIVERGLELAVAGNTSAILLMTGVTMVLTVGISSTATAVMYYRLRSIKESVDVDQIASVFA